MQWVLIFVVAGQITAVDGFEHDWACASAAKKVMPSLGEDAKFWCVPKK